MRTAALILLGALAVWLLTAAVVWVALEPVRLVAHLLD